MNLPKGHLLLINPWIYDFAAYDYWLKPLGLLAIASILRKNGYSLSIIDCLDSNHPYMRKRLRGKRPRKNELYGDGQFFKEEITKPSQLASVPRRYSRYGISPDCFIQELKKIKPMPDAILFTTLITYWYPGTSQAISIVKKMFPNTPVILGGNYPTLCPEHAINTGADQCIQGPGEKKILEILKEITGKDIIFLPDPADLDTLPYPAFDLLKHIDYICIQTSRGCPYRCTYCASDLINKGFRRRSPTVVLKEIRHWAENFGIKNIVFYDDALLYKSEEHIIPILDAIIHEGPHGLYFHTPNGLHTRFINPYLANILFESGFKTIRLGYETSSDKRQHESGGKVNTAELESAIAYLREAGYTTADIGVYILIGLPGQEAGEAESSIDKVVGLGGTPIITEFSPIPGTAIWEKAVEYSSYDLVRDPILHNNSIFPCQWSGFSWEDYLRIKTRVSTIRRYLKDKGASL